MRTSPRCLLCGSQLAFLTKLTSAFCSDQHRDEYHARVDSVVVNRLRTEKRRLIQRGAIAPAPLARLLRRGPQSISAPGVTKASAEPAVPLGCIAVPGQSIAVKPMIPQAGYFDGLSARRNPGIITIDCEPRGMRRQWPKAPRFTVCARSTTKLRSARTRELEPLAPRLVTIDVQAATFPRVWNVAPVRSAQVRAIRPAGQRLEVVSACPPAVLPWHIDSVGFERRTAIPVAAATRLAFRVAAGGFIAPRVHVTAPENLAIAHSPEIFNRIVQFPETTLRLDSGLMSAVWSRSAMRAAAGTLPVEEVGAAQFSRPVKIRGSRLLGLSMQDAGLLRVPLATSSQRFAAQGQPESCAFAPAVSHAIMPAKSAPCAIRPALKLVRPTRIPVAHVPDGLKGLIVGGQSDAFPRSTSLPVPGAIAGIRGISATASVLESATPRPICKRIEIVVDPSAEAFSSVALLPVVQPSRLGTPAGLLPLDTPSAVVSNRLRSPHIGMIAMRLRPLMPTSRLATTGIRAITPIPSVPVWKKIPPSWKRISIGIPVAAIALTVYLVGDRSNVSQVRAESSVLQNVMGDMRRDLNARAAIDLTDTFAAGLNQWSGAEKWSQSWTADQTGAVPGKLALLTASVPLRDYSAEFAGQIAKKALSFVIRARDLDNYYAVRFVVVTPGLLPEVVLERYSVVAGEESERVRTPIHMPLAHDSLYRVRTEVKGQNFTVYLNDQVADSWSDSRFPTGGIGFFGKKAEKARITGLHVWHQDDTVGRLLAHISRDDDKAAR